MEKRTQADNRHERFIKQAALAKELARQAMADIDDALSDHAEVATPHENYHWLLDRAVTLGEISPSEALLALNNFDAWEHRAEPDRLPITDDDTLASPLGYYEPPTSIT